MWRGLFSEVKQGTESSRMDPSKSSSDWNTSEKTGINQPPPPPYQPGHPYAGYPPNTYGYPAQPYGVPGGQPAPQVHYGQAPHPGQQPINVQPVVFVTPTPLARPLPDYLCYSIFTMLCCCFPLGVAALVYSIFTRNANMSGYQDLAEKNSSMARILNHVALGIGLTLIVLYTIYIIVMVTKLKED